MALLQLLQSNGTSLGIDGVISNYARLTMNPPETLRAIISPDSFNPNLYFSDYYKHQYAVLLARVNEQLDAITMYSENIVDEDCSVISRQDTLLEAYLIDKILSYTSGDQDMYTNIRLNNHNKLYDEIMLYEIYRSKLSSLQEKYVKNLRTPRVSSLSTPQTAQNPLALQLVNSLNTPHYTRYINARFNDESNQNPFTHCLSHNTVTRQINDCSENKSFPLDDFQHELRQYFLYGPLYSSRSHIPNDLTLTAKFPTLPPNHPIFEMMKEQFDMTQDFSLICPPSPIFYHTHRDPASASTDPSDAPTVLHQRQENVIHKYVMAVKQYSQAIYEQTAGIVGAPDFSLLPPQFSTSTTLNQNDLILKEVSLPREVLSLMKLDLGQPFYFNHDIEHFYNYHNYNNLNNRTTSDENTLTPIIVTKKIRIQKPSILLRFEKCCAQLNELLDDHSNIVALAYEIEHLARASSKYINTTSSREYLRRFFMNQYPCEHLSVFQKVAEKFNSIHKLRALGATNNDPVNAISTDDFDEDLIPPTATPLPEALSKPNLDQLLAEFDHLFYILMKSLLSNQFTISEFWPHEAAHSDQYGSISPKDAKSLELLQLSIFTNKNHSINHYLPWVEFIEPQPHSTDIDDDSENDEIVHSDNHNFYTFKLHIPVPPLPYHSDLFQYQISCLSNSTTIKETTNLQQTAIIFTLVDTLIESYVKYDFAAALEIVQHPTWKDCHKELLLASAHSKMYPNCSDQPFLLPVILDRVNDPHSLISSNDNYKYNINEHLYPSFPRIQEEYNQLPGKHHTDQLTSSEPLVIEHLSSLKQDSRILLSVTNSVSLYDAALSCDNIYAVVILYLFHFKHYNTIIDSNFILLLDNYINSHSHLHHTPEIALLTQIKHHATMNTIIIINNNRVSTSMKLTATTQFGDHDAVSFHSIITPDHSVLLSSVQSTGVSIPQDLRIQAEKLKNSQNPAISTLLPEFDEYTRHLGLKQFEAYSTHVLPAHSQTDEPTPSETLPLLSQKKNEGIWFTQEYSTYLTQKVLFDHDMTNVQCNIAQFAPSSSNNGLLLNSLPQLAPQSPPKDIPSPTISFFKRFYLSNFEISACFLLKNNSIAQNYSSTTHLRDSTTFHYSAKLEIMSNICQTIEDYNYAGFVQNIINFYNIYQSFPFKLIKNNSNNISNLDNVHYYPYCLYFIDPRPQDLGQNFFSTKPAIYLSLLNKGHSHNALYEQDLLHYFLNQRDQKGYLFEVVLRLLYHHYFRQFILPIHVLPEFDCLDDFFDYIITTITTTLVLSQTTNDYNPLLPALLQLINPVILFRNLSYGFNYYDYIQNEPLIYPFPILGVVPYISPTAFINYYRYHQYWHHHIVMRMNHFNQFNIKYIQSAPIEEYMRNQEAFSSTQTVASFDDFKSRLKFAWLKYIIADITHTLSASSIHYLIMTTPHFEEFLIKYCFSSNENCLLNDIIPMSKAPRSSTPLHNVLSPPHRRLPKRKTPQYTMSVPSSSLNPPSGPPGNYHSNDSPYFDVLSSRDPSSRVKFYEPYNLLLNFNYFLNINTVMEDLSNHATLIESATQIGEILVTDLITAVTHDHYNKIIEHFNISSFVDDACTHIIVASQKTSHVVTDNNSKNNRDDDDGDDDALLAIMDSLQFDEDDGFPIWSVDSKQGVQSLPRDSHYLGLYPSPSTTSRLPHSIEAVLFSPRLIDVTNSIYPDVLPAPKDTPYDALKKTKFVITQFSRLIRDKALMLPRQHYVRDILQEFPDLRKTFHSTYNFLSLSQNWFRIFDPNSSYLDRYATGDIKLLKNMEATATILKGQFDLSSPYKDPSGRVLFGKIVKSFTSQSGHSGNNDYQYYYDHGDSEHIEISDKSAILEKFLEVSQLYAESPKLLSLILTLYDACDSMFFTMEMFQILSQNNVIFKIDRNTTNPINANAVRFFQQLFITKTPTAVSIPMPTKRATLMNLMRFLSQQWFLRVNTFDFLAPFNSSFYQGAYRGSRYTRSVMWAAFNSLQDMARVVLGKYPELKNPLRRLITPRIDWEGTSETAEYLCSRVANLSFLLVAVYFAWKM